MRSGQLVVQGGSEVRANTTQLATVEIGRLKLRLKRKFIEVLLQIWFIDINLITDHITLDYNIFNYSYRLVHIKPVKAV